jgi:hypothetical protein
MTKLEAADAQKAKPLVFLDADLQLREIVRREDEALDPAQPDMFSARSRAIRDRARRRRGAELHRARCDDGRGGTHPTAA